MLIYVTNEYDFPLFVEFFHKADVRLLPKDYEGKSADMIVFPGGADVHPERAGTELFGNWYDRERDDFEHRVFHNWIRGRFSAKKVLGVCRGMQYLNVLLGGNLVTDIPTRFGKPHPPVHEIMWTVSNQFSWITKVNSSHHQAVDYIGDNIPRTVLGIESRFGVVESILWKDNILGMQFHPEYLHPSEEKEKIADILLKWAGGNLDIVEKKLRRIEF